MDSQEPPAGAQAVEAVKHYNRPGLRLTLYPIRSRPAPFDSLPSRSSFIQTRLHQAYQAFLDRTTPFTLYRWGTTAGLFVLFVIRILWVQAYYIVAYALGIYLLNLFLAFITPKFDPALASDLAETEAEEGAPGLPTSQGDLQDGEFRPFIRRLPEFKFWYSATRAVFFSVTASFFRVFDVPVFWPILVMYFCILTFITLKRQVGHMRKYKYLPFDMGRKETFGH
ncbi:hypothetical protein JCM11641_005044 [Rhodosporidiobolus odoratus]